MVEQSSSNGSAKFLHGSTMRHLVVMTASTATGLFAIFAVDFINIFYLNQLGEVEVSAAAGYATTLFFFLISIGIGLTISATALISPALGAGDLPRARRLTWNILVFTVAATAIISFLAWIFAGELAGLLGATGRTRDLTVSYLQIALPSTPFLTAAMVSAAVLRSVGDARLSMSVTLVGGMVTAILDPVFIFALDLGIEGAAIASSISRVASLAAGLYGVVRVHKLLSVDDANNFLTDAREINRFAIPAILTNLATPFANAYVTRALATFGDDAVAGWTIIARLFPIAFVGVFALSGSVGPVLGQNLGAKLFARVHGTYVNALIFTLVYTSAAWLLLALLHPQISAMMKATPAAASLVAFFCVWIVPLFVFMGALFVSNATLNNLRRPQLPAYINWGRATLGTIPLVMLGAELGGAKGVVAAQMGGAIIFGGLSVYLCLRFIARLTPKDAKPDQEIARLTARWWLWPFSNPRV